MGWFLLVVFLTCLILYILDKRDKNNQKKMNEKKKAETLAILKKWIGSDYIPEYNCVNVFYLNPAKKLIKMTMEDFLKLSVPSCDYPNIWIVCLSIGTKLSESDYIYLFNENGEWSFNVCTLVNKKEFYLKDKSQSYIFKTDSSPYEEAFRDVLVFVNTYKDGGEAWISQLQEYALPILAAAKDRKLEFSDLYMLNSRIEKGLRPYSIINDLFPPLPPQELKKAS